MSCPDLMLDYQVQGVYWWLALPSGRHGGTREELSCCPFGIGTLISFRCKPINSSALLRTTGVSLEEGIYGRMKSNQRV